MGQCDRQCAHHRLVCMAQMVAFFSCLPSQSALGSSPLGGFVGLGSHPSARMDIRTAEPYPAHRDGRGAEKHDVQPLGLSGFGHSGPHRRRDGVPRSHSSFVVTLFQRAHAMDSHRGIGPSFRIGSRQCGPELERFPHGFAAWLVLSSHGKHRARHRFALDQQHRGLRDVSVAAPSGRWPTHRSFPCR